MVVSSLTLGRSSAWKAWPAQVPASGGRTTGSGGGSGVSASSKRRSVDRLIGAGNWSGMKKPKSATSAGSASTCAVRHRAGENEVNELTGTVIRLIVDRGQALRENAQAGLFEHFTRCCLNWRLPSLRVAARQNPIMGRIRTTDKQNGSFAVHDDHRRPGRLAHPLHRRGIYCRRLPSRPRVTAGDGASTPMPLTGGRL